MTDKKIKYNTITQSHMHIQTPEVANTHIHRHADPTMELRKKNLISTRGKVLS